MSIPGRSLFLDLPQVTNPLKRFAENLLSKNGVKASPDIWILNKPGYNAMSATAVGIHFPVLETAKQDELGFVVAHELAHIVHKDSWKQWGLKGASLVSAYYAQRSIKSFGWKGPLPHLAFVGAVVAIGQGCAAARRWIELRADATAIRMLDKANYALGGHDAAIDAARESEEAFYKKLSGLPWLGHHVLSLLGKSHPSAEVRKANIARVRSELPERRGRTQSIMPDSLWDNAQNAIQQAQRQLNP